MKILELTNYTSGGCGVGMRVINESKFLAKRGHNVLIFSTNHIKGSNETCSSEENIGNIKIKRFPAKNLKLAGQSYLKWSFKKEALEFNPDVIIAHSYRHPHYKQALDISRKLRCKVFLVTHAPFGREDSRSRIQNMGVKVYDFLIGRRLLKRFDKVIAITRWELPYLYKLGLSKNKIVYLPNGVNEEFFKPINEISNLKRIVYLGRISPIKQIETLIGAMNNLIGMSCIIRGPAETNYYDKLIRLIKIKDLVLINKQYNFKEQIDILDNSDIFVLPSKNEGLPQALIEAMSRGRIVIASNNLASKDLINHGKNGFLFKNGDSRDLTDCINLIRKLSVKKINQISSEARKTAEKFKWADLIINLEKIIKL